jgi:hypothetical protein
VPVPGALVISGRWLEPESRERQAVRDGDAAAGGDMGAVDHNPRSSRATTTAERNQARGDRSDSGPQRTGRNTGRVTSGVRSSNATSTGMPMVSSRNGQSTTFDRTRAPSASSTTTTA